MPVKILMLIVVGMLGIMLFVQGCDKKTGSVQPTVKSETVPAATAKTVSLPTIIELGAKKCIPCKMMAPIIEELTKEFKGVLSVKFIDVWMQENVAIAQKFKIETIPTQIFLDKNGKELWRHEGYISKKDILEKWKKLGYDLEKLKKEQKK